MRIIPFVVCMSLSIAMSTPLWAEPSPIRSITARGSSDSLEDANRDLFRYFSESHQRRYGKMTVLASDIGTTTLGTKRISLVKAKVQMGPSKKTHWIAFSAWRHNGDVYRGVAYVFRSNISHKHFLVTKVKALLKKP